MNGELTNKEIIAAAIKIMHLMKTGKPEEASVMYTDANTQIKNLDKLPSDIAAIWIMIGISLNDPQNETYLNRIEGDVNEVRFKEGWADLV